MHTPLTHGSHRQHFFREVTAPNGVSCSICCAECKTSANWYLCTDPSCRYILCHKCFEVDECLFNTRQVVIRNPESQDRETGAFVYTRPRPNSHKLAPIYYGQLIEIVSSAHYNGENNTVLTYFRLKSGGWIDSREVVCVIPSDEVVDKLAQCHIDGVNNPNMPISLNDLRVYMRESIHLSELNPPYGTVLSSLVIYPLLSSIQRPNGVSLEECATRMDMEPISIQMIQFIHYNMEMVLGLVEEWIEDERPFDSNVVLSLYIQLLAGLLLACQNLCEQWGITLPGKFVDLFLRSFVVLGSTVYFLRNYMIPDNAAALVPLLCNPAVVTCHEEKAIGLNRLTNLSQVMIETTGRLIVGCLEHHELKLSQLNVFRQFLNFAKIEQLEKCFCDLVALAADSSAVHQRQILNVDPMEIIARLGRDPKLVESQVSIFRAVSSIVRRNARNIAAVSTVLLPDLIKLCDSLRNTSAVTAALECMYEVAYNDPRLDSDSVQRTPRGRGGEKCGKVQYGMNSLPYQLMFCYEFPGSKMLTCYCQHCAMYHPPANAVQHMEPQYAYFQCQCAQSRCTEINRYPVPPPAVPASCALAVIAADGGKLFLSFLRKANTTNDAVVNAIGRLSFRVELPHDIILTLFMALLERTDLTRTNWAALAVCSYTHLPEIAEGLARYPAAPIACYVRAQQTMAKGVVYPDDSHSQPSSQMKSELGLSPSPCDNHSYRSPQSFQEPRGSSQMNVFHHPGELFTSQYQDEF
ncbi:hypothetical protein AGDE_12061 [Angomonas deanei]|uniref:Uncharacterized protein n=1 Tax=Angomonas deanei TaxID=59799 RepID=A0A7G2C0H3_9TRYP|nr:hypothetical protein AGDE_12061 [Angomonas deanei]CAD2213288.1 hypothetical protein, conserved [Angomonas deanei]|eukprot:EPY25019.1 hypothetical protein AGDE_12061 [Angomonas deanei]